MNIFLAFIWAAATGDFSESNLVFGFALGFAIISFTQRASGSGDYMKRGWRIVSFAAFFIQELVLANVRVARDVISRSQDMRPGIVAIPLSARTDNEITLLANLISLTPGTLSLDVSDDRSVLYIHSMYIDDPDEVRHEIKAGFERRVLEVLR